MHQVVEQEAQMLAFMLEQEYGAEPNLLHCNRELELDKHLDKGIKTILFRKYFSITRLQSTIHSRKYTEDLLKSAQRQDKDILDYSFYLKKKCEDLDESNHALKLLI